jgi:hypothetical protein
MKEEGGSMTKPKRVSTLLLTALAAALLFIMPGSVYAAQSAQSKAAGTPEQAVSVLVTPFFDASAGATGCNGVTGDIAGCPVTARLLDRLQHPTPQENGNILSRSQNPPRDVTVKVVDNDGQTAHVDTRWGFGGGSYGITFVVLHQADGWLVDDTYCAGEPGTSIYNAPAGPCQVIAFSGGTAGGGTSGGTPGAVPGMPQTGQKSDGYLLFASLLVLAVASGVGLSVAGRRAAR